MPEKPTVPEEVTKPTDNGIQADPPVHPFAKVPETMYVPPHEHNFDTPAGKSSREKEPAYHTQAPIQNPALANNVYKHSMKTPCVTLTPEELLLLSPEICSKVCEVVTSKRIVAGDTNISTNVLVANIYCFEEVTSIIHPDGSIVVPDPYETYLKGLKEDQKPELLTVAKDSHALRSITMLIDNKEFVECIVNPGSQIIAMSEDLCHDLGLIYNPIIYLNVQSANSDIGLSCGLARNVPTKVEDITLYLQMHVI